MAIRAVSNNVSTVQNTDSPQKEQMRPNISDSDRAEFDEFREKIEESVKAGNMDVSALSEIAPESFKEMVEAHGDTLESAIEKIATGKVPPKGPPPDMDGDSQFKDLSRSETSALDELKTLESTISTTSSSGDVPAPDFRSSIIDWDETDGTLERKKDKITEEDL